jgi:hypothetical protein
VVGLLLSCPAMPQLNSTPLNSHKASTMLNIASTQLNSTQLKQRPTGIILTMCFCRSFTHPLFSCRWYCRGPCLCDQAPACCIKRHNSGACQPCSSSCTQQQQQQWHFDNQQPVPCGRSGQLFLPGRTQGSPTRHRICRCVVKYSSSSALLLPLCMCLLLL